MLKEAAAHHLVIIKSPAEKLDLLAILRKPGSSFIFPNFIREIRWSDVQASITVVNIRKFNEM